MCRDYARAEVTPNSAFCLQKADIGGPETIRRINEGPPNSVSPTNICAGKQKIFQSRDQNGRLRVRSGLSRPTSPSGRVRANFVPNRTTAGPNSTEFHRITSNPNQRRCGVHHILALLERVSFRNRCQPTCNCWGVAPLGRRSDTDVPNVPAHPEINLSVDLKAPMGSE